MTTASIDGVAIRAIAGAVPGTVRTNADIGDESDRAYVEKMSTTVGVRQRRVVRPGQFGSDLAVAAANEVLDELGWSRDTIDLVVAATQTPDRLFPGISFTLHRQLGMGTACTVFDVNLGCSAFTHGLWITSTLLRGTARRALLINADTMSRTLGPRDLGNQVLFGDGATATALELDQAPPLTFVTVSDGKGTEAVCLPHSAMSAAAGTRAEFVINGPAVLGLALRSVPKLIAQLLEATKTHPADVDLFVPHQANKFILDKLADKIAIEKAGMLVEMEYLGNTSSASIPLALCASRERLGEHRRRAVVMVGFGTGFSLSAAMADLSATRLLGIVDVP